MAGELRISRPDRAISADEWLAAIAGDPELQLEQTAEITSPGGQTISIRPPGVMALWTAHPDGVRVRLVHSHGRIVAKPDEPTIEKMLAIAASLDATVVGEEGEQYTLGGVVP